MHSNAPLEGIDQKGGTGRPAGNNLHRSLRVSEED